MHRLSHAGDHKMYTLDDIQQLTMEHQALLRGYGRAQMHSSELLRLQAREIERLQAQAVRQQAALIARDTLLMWAREDREALDRAMPGLSRRATLARRVETLLARVQDLLRERALWQREAAKPRLPEAGALFMAGSAKAGAGHDDEAIEASLREADLVICQTGCLSHGDYWRVQDHCQRTGKTCVLVEQPDALRIVRFHRTDEGEAAAPAAQALKGTPA
jgi:hypothetical protein